MYCPRCHAALEREDQRCWACGRRLGPSVTRPALYTIAVAVLSAILLLAATRLWAAAKELGDTEKAATHLTATSQAPAVIVAPPPPGVTSAPSAPAPVKATVVASAQTGPAENGCLQTTSYDAANVQDGDPATAWRTLGDGTGQTLQLTLPGPTHLTQVGLIPGYDKIDNCTAADRFAQMRKVTSVKWTFDDGSTVDQTFALDRTMQTKDVNVTTTSVTLEITGTTPPGDLDFTPMSEVSLVGSAA